MQNRLPELLAPAGDRACAFAALEYGADAIYLGLRQFSARADAVNFSPEELSEVVDYAHRMSPARRVYATFNTLVQDNELNPAIRTLAVLEEIGVDAVIVQDLGMIRLIRRGFPRLRLHASTQMAIHERTALDQLVAWGFRRVTLARELSLVEIQELKRETSLEIEVFAHGALCYSYSGLCLYSSLLRGRSGNRGRCAYPCRSPIRWGAEPRYSFSMKDLALEEQVRKLVAAGVDSLKIEGRKKSPLFVAAVTALYRRILDGAPRAEIEERSGDVRSIFSRAPTTLCLDQRHASEVLDPGLVGHRGRLVGVVREVRRRSGGRDELVFKTSQPLERHDGLQLDIPVDQGKPFGFAVDHLHHSTRPAGPFRETVRASAGDWVAVELPQNHPDFGPGMDIHCAASQTVRRAYPVTCPRPGEYRVRHPIAVRVEVHPDRIRFNLSPVENAEAAPPAEETWEFSSAFDKCREPADQTPVFQKAFARVAEFPYTVSRLTLQNPEGLFCPVSRINEWRRTILAEYQERTQLRIQARLVALLKLDTSATQGRATPSSLRSQRLYYGGVGPGEPSGLVPGSLGDLALPKILAKPCVLIERRQRSASTTPTVKWSLKIDRPEYVDGLTSSDWAEIDEVILTGSEALLQDPDRAIRFAQRIAPIKVRLALPLIVRETDGRERVARLRQLAGQMGVEDWQGTGIGAPLALGLKEYPNRTVTADWNLYGLNRQAMGALFEMGFSEATSSPEDDGENLVTLAAEFSETLNFLVYHTVPLFIADHCPHPCRNERSCATCDRESAADALTKPGEEEGLRILHRDGLTITLNRRAFCLPPDFRMRLIEAGARRFRAEFCWRTYTPDEVCAIWRLLLKGEPIPETEIGNLRRGLK
jgi:putative protease